MYSINDDEPIIMPESVGKLRCKKCKRYFGIYFIKNNNYYCPWCNYLCVKNQ